LDKKLLPGYRRCGAICAGAGRGGPHSMASRRRFLSAGLYRRNTAVRIRAGGRRPPHRPCPGGGRGRGLAARHFRSGRTSVTLRTLVGAPRCEGRSRYNHHYHYGAPALSPVHLVEKSACSVAPRRQSEEWNGRPPVRGPSLIQPSKHGWRRTAEASDAHHQALRHVGHRPALADGTLDDPADLGWAAVSTTFMDLASQRKAGRGSIEGDDEQRPTCFLRYLRSKVRLCRGRGSRQCGFPPLRPLGGLGRHLPGGSGDQKGELF